MIKATINSLRPGEYRYEKWQDKTNLVVPAVILVEGVHNDLYYPASAISELPDAWNGVPVPFFHPKDEETGQPISANEPEIVAECAGRVWNAEYDEDIKGLRVEFWLEMDKLVGFGQNVVDEIINGKMEVSTGLFGDLEEVKGKWADEEYIGVFTHYVPDHVALLPGAVGACSWVDGCGIRVNTSGLILMRGGDIDCSGIPTKKEAQTLMINILSKARTPSYSGTEETSWGDVKKTFANYRDAYYDAKGKPDEVAKQVADAPAAMKTWIAGKTLLGDPGADNERGLLFFPVVNPGTGKLNKGALMAVIGGRGAQADIAEAAKGSAQNKARSLLKKEFKVKDEENEGTTLIKRMVKSLAELVGMKTNDVSHDELRSMLQALIREKYTVPGTDMMPSIWIREVFDGYFVYELGSALYRHSYKSNEEGATLEGEPVEVYLDVRYIEVTNKENSATENSGSENNKEVENMSDKIKVLVDKIIATGKFVEDDRGWLATIEEARLEKLVVATEIPKAPEPAATTGPVEKKADPVVAEDKATATIETKAATLELPDDIKQALLETVAANKARKKAIVDKILAAKGNKFVEVDLMARPMVDLESIEALIPVPEREGDYSANTGSPTGGQKKINERQPDGSGIPDMPAMSWNQNRADFSKLN